MSENQIFLLFARSGRRFVLRVHRPGYQTEAAINSELAWLAAIARDTAVPVAMPVAGADGAWLQRITTNGGERLAVLFDFVEGIEPPFNDALIKTFETLGTYAATLHQHVMTWTAPAGFVRPHCDAAAILDANSAWGDWRTTPGLGAAELTVLERLDEALRQRLADYGTERTRYGLIHADMRLGNLLANGPTLTLIDFDDCSYGWFAYDFAAAISFHEAEPMIPTLRAAWLEGYRKTRAFSDDDAAMLEAMVMLRRMALLAWIGSHGETKLARTHEPGFVAGTVRLAERYLRGSLWD